MKWTVAKARRHFSELLRQVAKEPRTILNRNRAVAAVVDAELFREFVDWYSKRHRRTLGDAFDELRSVCADEEYSLELPRRKDRENRFARVLDELSC